MNPAHTGGFLSLLVRPKELTAAYLEATMKYEVRTPK